MSLSPPAALSRWTRFDPNVSRVRISGMTDGARAYYLTALARDLRRAGAGRPLIAVAPTEAAARRLYEDLRFFEDPEGPRVLLFPSWELAPLEPLSPTPKTVGQRLCALAAWSGGGASVTVTSAAALAQKMVPPAESLSAARTLSPGHRLDRDELVEDLLRAGYQRAAVVEDEGEYAVRGALVDVFPPQSESPVRIELDEEGVFSLRRFQVADQRSVERLDRVEIVPAREVLFTEDSRARAAERLRRWARTREVGERDRLELLADRLLEDGHFPGLETFAPLLRDGLIAGVEALPPGGLVALSEPDALVEADAARWDRLQEAAAPGGGALPFALEDFALAAGEVLRALRARAAPGVPLVELSSLALGMEGEEEGLSLLHLPTSYPGTFQGQIPAFVRQVKAWLARGMRVAVLAVHRTQALRLKQILQEFELGARTAEGGGELLWESRGPEIVILIGRLSEGFQSEELGWVVIREEEIFYAPARRRAAPSPRRKAFEAAFRNLGAGDYVVHRDYGIGVYQGVDRIGLAGEEREFLVVEYQGGDKLFVPMENLNLVQKYMGAGQGAPKIDRLGGTAWTRTKRKTKAAVLEMARELMRLAAKRQVAQGRSFPPDDHWSREFAASFPYEETPDQFQAIQEVTEDMEKPRPMDRLVCGDVGFGKTEVALRAAFKAVLDKKQVCLLAPTTILAEQHYRTFRERFSKYAVVIECLTRFRGRSELRDILDRLAAGRVDVLIGTHRVLQSDVKFRDLGLVVVDEEQRFGVTHKEKLKGLRASVDVLTLTATPIPRTLHMGLLGLRDLSVINTPPPDRLAVRTYVCQFEDRVIREALNRELERGGQAFFVHPRVETIEATARYLLRLLPGLRLTIAHGQIGEKRLHEAMVGFLERKYNVLLCTTIIENGLDIPNANTILVNRAEMYGLAELYQLRGRVGRSDRQAYAYFLVQAGRVLTQAARRRLKALEELSELGAGFRLAAQDLEIRGAGNILGAEQSGHIAAVGFDLYCRLLEEAAEELRGERAVHRKEPELSLGLRASLPEDYVPGQNQRLELYREIADTQTTGELEELRRALADRFGPLPPAAASLFEAARLRILASRAGVEKLVVSDGFATFHAEDRPYHLTPEFLAIPGLKFVDQRTFRVPVPKGLPERLDSLGRVLIALEACARMPEDAGGGQGAG
ncbi:MAG: transcription-repair coupling factor [Candidatus Tectomicrobia bacterium]|nr:transcription-repair coupling factor [Candidatus Tectomicrobia bacterium]